MFHDSIFAKNFSCNKIKSGCLAIHGLSLYFEKSSWNVEKSFHLLSVIWWSFNKYEQIYIIIRYYVEDQQSFVERYLNYNFLGHTTAADLLENFREVTKMLEPEKILQQVSTDGPKVNLKFHKDMQLEREAKDVC